ncbi:two-component system, LytT family, sensor kinase [Dethiosulfatibacter aminovorans DSM 17477]|uniref:histidine kinase n=1 Tax=Dethiosulfatibacter aminovorans DSM 17477 TaxID=1121476 RepID=A0A1M6ISI3_9FIRM|nr:histidine kinase [Dethiosulfatibacter aminovorans]SHJ37430.1 two-component system, LytT family, sensor kinase [Dethiosulfatibacter aminovorans DSM 17477]
MKYLKLNYELIFIYILVLHVTLFGGLFAIDPNHWNYYLILMVFSFTLNSLILYSYNHLHNKKVEQSMDEFKTLEDTIRIADKTMPLFSQGLNEETAYKIANTVKIMTNAPSVAITDKKNVLAFIGAGCEKHPVGYPIKTQATLDALKSGEIKIIRSKEEFNCTVNNCNCPLESAIIVPLSNQHEVIGSLKIYETHKGEVQEDKIRLASGMGKLLNMQIELAELDRQRQLATSAKLDALQAQVNPHFLFNALNAVSMYITKDPKYAKKLIVKLSQLLRYMLKNTGRFITLKEEISHIENYVALENARFQDKIEILYDIDKDLGKLKIPVLSIQPLVQNSILHGLIPKEGKGTVTISAHKVDDKVLISVTDNGVGIMEGDVEKVFTSGYGKGCGVGVPNVNERLKMLYGKDYSLEIRSKFGAGTKAYFSVPFNKEG